ncbi:MAG TPA: hypothetical protein VK909_18455 [Anaerolineales bacterium]|nr:hypothetical protein [Anaerolineales bacterium]
MEEKETQRSLATWSILLFGLSLVCWLALTLFESLLVGTSLVAQRAITFVLLVLPGTIGVLLGIMSLVRKEGKAWLAILSIVLNTVFALFNFMIVLFAG